MRFGDDVSEEISSMTVSGRVEGIKPLSEVLVPNFGLVVLIAFLIRAKGLGLRN